tara:strand:- start:330 stop:962 length:633 start_codon:yes stop_codon:yes gene_type:complete
MRSSILKEIFKDYVAHEIEFLVLRNHEDIPNKISIDNDLDLLVKADCNKKLIKIMQNYSFKVHIEKFSSNEYLYKSLPHIHFYNFKNNIHFDVVNNLSYKSPNNNEWVSVHEEIQKSIWENRLKTNYFWFYKPSIQDELIHLICHCLFDKKSFNNKYKGRIEELISKCDEVNLRNHLELIFFKFTDKLISILNNGKFDNINQEYFSFSNY